MDQPGDEQPLLEAAASAEGPSDQREPSSQRDREDGLKARGRQAGEQRAEEGDSKPATAPLRYAAPLGGRRGAMMRSLPVIFVLSLIAVVVGVYLSYHIAPLLQQHASDRDAFSRGLGEVIAFSLLLTLFLTCFALSVFVRPGTPDEGDEEVAEQGVEIKSSGGVRVCKWCALPKPDRTHHCRVCRTCVLRMDHHCPWLANCVGWGNHKYFMLLLFYGTLTCVFVGATMMESVIRIVGQPKAAFWELFAILLGSTLDFFLAVVLLLFGSFHLYLLTKGMTTIEFCEKRFRRTDVQPPPDLWNLGFWRNFNEAFGYNPFLWFMPIDNRVGDGKHFVPSQPGLNLPRADLEPGLSRRQSAAKPSH
ncbi:hypothetical protein Emed_001679 [Eimeria media]